MLFYVNTSIDFLVLLSRYPAYPPCCHLFWNKAEKCVSHFSLALNLQMYRGWWLILRVFHLIANSPCCETKVATCVNMPLSSAMVDSTACRALDLLCSSKGMASCCICICVWMGENEATPPVRRLHSFNQNALQIKH